MLDSIECKRLEYAPTVRECQSGDRIDWDKLSYLLTERHGWTPAGAGAIITLAQEYGSFILANAYALALTLKIEDGESGL